MRPSGDNEEALAAEAVALEADGEDRAEMLAVAEAMASMGADSHRVYLDESPGETDTTSAHAPKKTWRHGSRSQ